MHAARRHRGEHRISSRLERNAPATDCALARKMRRCAVRGQIALLSNGQGGSTNSAGLARRSHDLSVTLIIASINQSIIANRVRDCHGLAMGWPKRWQAPCRRRPRRPAALMVQPRCAERRSCVCSCRFLEMKAALALLLATTALGCGRTVELAGDQEDAGVEAAPSRGVVDRCAELAPWYEVPDDIRARTLECEAAGCTFLMGTQCDPLPPPDVTPGCYPSRDCDSDLDCPDERFCRIFSAQDNQHPAKGGCSQITIIRHVAPRLLALPLTAADGSSFRLSSLPPSSPAPRHQLGRWSPSSRGSPSRAPGDRSPPPSSWDP